MDAVLPKRHLICFLTFTIISRANDVVVVNNRFKNTNLSRVPDANPNLNGSIVVTHAHNVHLSKNAMAGARALWIDTTSTDGIRH